MANTLERKREKVRVIMRERTDVSLDSIDDSASEVSSVMQIGDPDEELPEPDLDQDQLGDDVSINELVSSLFIHILSDTCTRVTCIGIKSMLNTVG